MKKHLHRCVFLVALVSLLVVGPAVAQQPPPRGQAPPRGQPRPAAGFPAQRPPPRSPAAPQVQRPFPPLNPQQQAFLDQVLAAWEHSSSKIKTFRCDFTRWTYNPAFQSEKFKDKPLFESDGKIFYQSPDKGSFRVTEVRKFDAKTEKLVPNKEEPFEHWVTDGKTIWEYDSVNKKVVEHHLPPDQQGRAIRNGPLPFLFGSTAASLKERYFLRIITPKDFHKSEFWIDAFPRRQRDAANFRRAVLRIDHENFRPVAIRVYDPGAQFASYAFAKVAINDRFEGLRRLFSAPRVPLGWQLVKDVPQPPRTARPPRSTNRGLPPRR